MRIYSFFFSEKDIHSESKNKRRASESMQVMMMIMMIACICVCDVPLVVPMPYTEFVAFECTKRKRDDGAQRVGWCDYTAVKRFPVCCAGVQRSKVELLREYPRAADEFRNRKMEKKKRRFFIKKKKIKMNIKKKETELKKPICIHTKKKFIPLKKIYIYIF